MIPGVLAERTDALEVHVLLRLSARALGLHGIDLLLGDELLGDGEHPCRPREGALVELLDGGVHHLAEAAADLLRILGKRDDAAHRRGRGARRGHESLLERCGRRRHRPGRDLSTERPERLGGRDVHTHAPELVERGVQLGIGARGHGRHGENLRQEDVAPLRARSRQRGGGRASYECGAGRGGSPSRRRRRARGATARGRLRRSSRSARSEHRAEALDQERELAQVRGGFGRPFSAPATARRHGVFGEAALAPKEFDGAASMLSVLPRRPRFWARSSRSAAGQRSRTRGFRSSR